jgi:hypothetical protein
MRLKQKESDERVLLGQADALENLHLMGDRKAMRKVLAWLRGPHWHLSPEKLEAMRTCSRGLARNLRTGVSTEADSLSGEISVNWIASSPA